MLDKGEQRRLISQNISYLRFIQATGKAKNVEAIREAMGVSRTTADKIVKDLKVTQILNKDLSINAKYAAFMGVSMKYDGISISVVGSDGRKIQWNDILKQNEELEGFTGKIEAEYSINGLVNSSELLNKIILYVKNNFPIKAVCFSFDDVDKMNKKIAFSTYSDTRGEMSFMQYCHACIKTEGIDEIFLENNSMSQLIVNEFSKVGQRRERVVYLDIQRNGCYAALILNNKISYGYQLQSLCLSNLLDVEEKNSIEARTETEDNLTSIAEKLLKPYVLALNPEFIYFTGSVVQDNAKTFDNLCFKATKIKKECGARNYCLDLVPIFEAECSTGAAILAMYRYYQWNGHF